MTKQDYVNLLGGSVVLHYYSLKEIKSLYDMKISGYDIRNYLSEYKRVNVREEVCTQLKEKGICIKKVGGVSLPILEYINSSEGDNFLKLDLTRLQSVVQLENCSRWLASGIPLNKIYNYKDVTYSEPVATLLSKYKFKVYKDYLKYGETFSNYCDVVLRLNLDFEKYAHLSNTLGMGESLIKLSEIVKIDRSVSADVYVSHIKGLHGNLYRTIPCNTDNYSKLVFVEYLDRVCCSDRKLMKKRINSDGWLSKPFMNTTELYKYIYCLIDGFEYDLYMGLNLNDSELRDILDMSYELIEDKQCVRNKLYGLTGEVME